ncbi:hypothetical protein M422DRAFT_65695 [Sphaerobolus stellatus SS14]|nr:hypothetical protein M422DRAFT_65695 [Sphaerobolus stellatus SS14]
MPPLPPKSLIVITGITGYIASHIALLILRDGHRIRGTARPSSLSNAEALKSAFANQGLDREDLNERLEIVPLDFDNFLSEEKCLKLFDGVYGIIHVVFKKDSFLSPELTNFLMETTSSMLKAAAKTSTLRRFVFTSSSAAVRLAPHVTEKPLGTEDWNDAAINVMTKGVSIDSYPEQKSTHIGMPYAAGKAMSEQLGFEFVKNEKPGFDFVSIIPNFTFGPLLYPKPSSSIGVLLSAMKGDSSYRSLFVSQWFVDVRDVAALHYLGLSEDSMANKRWLAVSEPFGHNQIFAILRKHFPDAPIPEDFEGGGIDQQRYNRDESTDLLGRKWIGLEQSILDSVESFKKVELL